jgi:hypothetical protein
MRPPAKTSVLAAPTAVATAEDVSATSSARSLCGIVMLAPAKPRDGSSRTSCSKRSGGTSIAS